MTNEELLLYKEKIQHGNVDAIFVVANYYYENQEYEKAFLTISRFKYQYSKEGFKKLGYYYEKGIGTAIDYKKAYEYYLKAYEMGDIGAGFNIALMFYKQGKYEECIKYLVEGRINNHLPSLRLLGELYYKGIGVDQNNQIAIQIYKAIVELGDKSYIDKIGKLYYQMEEYYEAFKYFSLGSEILDYDCIYHLAICYSKGQGVSQDIPKAIYYYEIGANNNHVGCIYNLAIHYQNGIGVSVNLDRANQLFEMYSKLKKAKNNL